MTVHPDEHLSAWLDDELDPVAAQEVHGHIEGCPVCELRRDDLARVRAMVRGLPPVEPPEGFYDGLLRRRAHRRRRIPALVGAVASVAAIWVVAVGLGVGIDVEPLAPPVDEFVGAHTVARTAAPPPMPEITAPFDAPATLASFVLLGGERTDGVVHLTYGDGDRMVSIFQQEGSLDADGLPSGGDMIEMDGHPMWVGLEEGEHVMVADTGGLVITVVAQMPHDDMMRVAEDLPEPRDRSMVDNVRRGTRDLIGIFGFD